MDNFLFLFCMNGEHPSKRDWLKQNVMHSDWV